MSQRNKGRGSPNRKRGYGGKNRAPREFDAKAKTSDLDGKFDSARNDWRWYATNPQLVKDSASYPYSYPVGSRINLGPYGARANAGSIAGVAALAFVPLVGYSNHANSPINVASRSIYSDIRHTNSGGVNYDPPDMMEYLVAMDSCYMILEFMKRAYGTMRLVSPVNRYMPVALIRAMGLDFASINANLADFRAAINTYAQKLKALVIPNGMSYMAKHQWLVSGIYQDHATDKSQFYVFTPHAFFKFAKDSDGAGKLESINGPAVGAPWTYETCVQTMNQLLDPLLAEQDFSIMSGDILKWRGQGGVVVPSGITEDYQVFPVYDDSVLDQINNAVMLGNPKLTTTTSGPAAGVLEVRQDANKEYLISTPYFRHPETWDSDDPNPGLNAYLVDRFVNFMHESVTPEETMEATRLTNIAREVIPVGSASWLRYETLGSEALTRMVVYWYQEITDVTTQEVSWSLESTVFSSISQVIRLAFDHRNMTESDFKLIMTHISNTLHKCQLLATFDRHPMVALTAGLTDYATTSPFGTQYSPFSGYMNDINYYTIVDEQDLTQMSEVALMSEFNVRMQG